MIYEGVNFNEGAVREMTSKEFEARHLELFWKDRDKETRRKMLAEVYGLINPKPAKAKKKIDK